MKRETTLEADEVALLARNEAVATIHEDAVRVGRASIAEVMGVHESMRRSDVERFNREVHALQRRSLVDYALRVRGLLAEDDAGPWRQKVERRPAGARNDLLREVGVPGALLLLDAMEPVPDEPAQASSLEEALARVADRCTCGYAKTRAVPRRLCLVCAMSVNDAWLFEEQRLLERSPQLARELDAIFDPLLDRIADMRNSPMEGFSDLAASLRRKASGRIAKANRAHREVKAQGDDKSWQELAILAALDPRPFPAGDAKRWKRTGWGSARLSAVSLGEGNPEVKARMTKRAQTR